MESTSLSNPGIDTTSIMLDRSQSEALRSLIDKHIDCKFSTYLMRVGFDPANIYAIFAGRRKLTVKTLEKLLSGTNLVVECRIEFLVQICGSHVSNVPSPNLEEMLSSETGEELEMDQLIGRDPPYTIYVPQAQRKNQD